MMFGKNAKTPLEKERLRLSRQEMAFREHWVKKRRPGWTGMIADKIPEKLQNTLDKAFTKAFSVLFEKGIGVIERTYHKEELQKTYQINRFAADLRKDSKSFRKFSGGAVRAEAANTLMSGVSGIGLGVLGIGLPDILVFTGLLLKVIYEIALQYGFDYAEETEKSFILLLIQSAVSDESQFTELDAQLNDAIWQQETNEELELEERLGQTAAALSHELLYMKFLQGIPVVGVIGGAYDFVYTKRILEYAGMKYKRRFLEKMEE